MGFVEKLWKSNVQVAIPSSPLQVPRLLEFSAGKQQQSCSVAQPVVLSYKTCTSHAHLVSDAIAIAFRCIFVFYRLYWTLKRIQSIQEINLDVFQSLYC